MLYNIAYLLNYILLSTAINHHSIPYHWSSQECILPVHMFYQFPPIKKQILRLSHNYKQGWNV